MIDIPQAGRAPRVMTVHDLSGVGRCALTVVLPVLSCMGVQACPLPTALLSTHPGGFGSPAVLAVEDFFEQTLSHWQQCELDFEGIYSGYLASPIQGQTLKAYLLKSHQNDERLVLCDPVLGDHGKLYAAFDETMVDAQRALCARADVITPNLTEACLLTGIPFEQKPLSWEKTRTLLYALRDLGPARVVITSVPLDDGTFDNAVLDGDQTFFLPFVPLPVSYPGTGDVFASVLMGGLMRKMPFKIALQKAHDFIFCVVKATYEAKTPPREGVLIESQLHQLSSFT